MLYYSLLAQDIYHSDSPNIIKDILQITFNPKILYIWVYLMFS